MTTQDLVKKVLELSDQVPAEGLTKNIQIAVQQATLAPILARRLQKAIEQRNNALHLYYREVKGSEDFQIQQSNAELDAIE